MFIFCGGEKRVWGSCEILTLEVCCPRDGAGEPGQNATSEHIPLHWEDPVALTFVVGGTEGKQGIAQRLPVRFCL